MSFEKYLKEQISLHPSMKPQDMLKLSFQAAYGAEHLLQDHARAHKYLLEEFESVTAADGALYEEISDDYIRINLSAWKYKKLPINWLFNIFLESIKIKSSDSDRFKSYLDICRSYTNSEQWDIFIGNYLDKGIRPVHHSDFYREKEKPAYRLANKCFVRVLPILEAAASCTKKPCVIAIDGRAASGKSTLGRYLSMVMGADIIHMDDFFLPPSLRTKERMEEVGGNVHYERFYEEILPRLHDRESFSYNIFSCSKMNFDGKREVASDNYRIVEGVYSLHPSFGDYADICVFSDVDSQTQMERILERDGKKYAEIFSSTWIPMEEAYFDAYIIKEKCAVHI